MDLVNQLKNACNSPDGNVAEVLGKITDLADNSGFDPNILRALRKRRLVLKKERALSGGFQS